jgi:hypothetical protein
MPPSRRIRLSRSHELTIAVPEFNATRERWITVGLILGCALMSVLVATVIGFVVWAERLDGVTPAHQCECCS